MLGHAMAAMLAVAAPSTTLTQSVQLQHVRWQPVLSVESRRCPSCYCSAVQRLLRVPQRAVVAKRSTLVEAESTQPQPVGRSIGLRMVAALAVWAIVIAGRAGAALATGALPRTDSAVLIGKQELLVRFCIWVGLFSLAALLASAETAITTLWPWKAKQLAAEECVQGPPGVIAPAYGCLQRA